MPAFSAPLLAGGSDQEVMPVAEIRFLPRVILGAMTQGATFRRLVVAPSRDSTSSRYETAVITRLA